MSTVPNTFLPTEPTAFLQSNSAAYEWLVGKIQALDSRKDAENVLRYVEKAAWCAALFHSGRFADGAIENVALEIGARLDELAVKEDGLLLPIAPPKKSCLRVLHVLTGVYGIGGHTRMAYHWVRNDRSSCHSVVLTNQGDVPILQGLSEAVSNSGGTLIVFPQGVDLCQKALWLRKLAVQSADLVVLHHGFYDVVPTVSFAMRECPPVAVLNHADHQFWLGSSVSDLIINLRSVGSDYSVQRRFVLSNMVLPIPLAEPINLVSRQSARQVLGIPEDQIMLLSVGRAEKYHPCGSFDFIATAGKILTNQAGAHLYVIGGTFGEIVPYLRSAVHDHLHFVGSVEDPSLYHAAADIYLESFPFGSQTALLEAALSGLPVVPAYAPLCPMLVANDDALNDVLCNPLTEQEYRTRAELLIQEPERRLEMGRMLKKRLLIDHVGKGWLTRLAEIYHETATLTHNPRPIPVSECNITEADIGLSLWNVIADGKSKQKNPLDIDEGAVLRHAAFVAKYVGDSVRARQFAWRAVCHDPYRRISWRLLVAIILGKQVRFVWQILFGICKRAKLIFSYE
jgi:glycosyltransferase involved in cell wall biosynthesis